MRIKLKTGKQKELILEAKKSLSWVKLASKLNINARYLSQELKNEKRLLKDSIYEELKEITKINYDKFIDKKLEDNWGKSKGGLNSEGSTINIKFPEKDERLAELIGAILGDGNISYHKGYKIGVYQVNITGHKELDKDYHLNYLSNIFRELFNIKTIELLAKKNNGRHLVATSRKLVEFLIKDGLKAGNKIKNKTTIPLWIWEKDSYLKACLRGLIDTDGSIFRMSNKDPNLLRISFTNYNLTLINDARKAFTMLGLSPSKIIKNKQFFLSRKADISKYLKEIGFSNKKHTERLEKFIAS